MKKNVFISLIIIIAVICCLGIFWHSRSTLASILSGYDIRKGIVGYWTMNASDQQTSGSYLIFNRGGDRKYDLVQRQAAPVSLQAATSTPGNIKEGVYLSNGVFLSNDFITNLKPFSMALWVKLPLNQDLTGTTTNIIIGKWNGSWAVGYPFVLEVTNSSYGVAADVGKVRGSIWDLANNPTVTSTIAINDNEWHHLIFQTDSSNLKLYVDGELSDTKIDTAGGVSNSWVFEVGKTAQVTNNMLLGAVDDLRIYSRALTDTEAKRLYQMKSSVVSKTPETYGPTTVKSDLAGWWTFDQKDMTSTAVTDISGLGNNGTRYGVTKPIAGKLGQGLNLDGASSTVQVADSNSLDLTTNLTLSAWAKRNELSRADSVISKGSYGLKVGADDRPYFEILNGTENFADTGALSTSTRVFSLAVFNGKLYAGTYISSEVFRYDGGTTWTSVGVLKDNNATVYALKVYNGNLYGSTSSVGGAEIYRYDGGTTWTSVGTVGATTFISALVVYNNKLYAQGSGYNNYRYDGGTTWTSVGSSGGGVTYSFAVYNGKLYAGAATTGKVFRYEDDGATWTDIGAALGSYVMSLTVYNGNLYAGALSTSTVYRYDGGTTWTSIGALGSSTGLRSLVVYNGKLYGAGIDATTPSSLYRYDGGTTWTSIGQFCPTCSSTRTLAVYDGKIYGGTWDNGNVYSMGSGEAIYSTTSTSSGFNHLAGTYDGTTMKLFVNGAMNTSIATSTVVATNTLPLLIGSSAGSSGTGIGEENLNGIIDDARIYNRALSDKEISELATAGVNTVNITPGTSGAMASLGINSGLNYWWTFDGKDITSATATDRGAISSDGTREGTSIIAGRIGQGLYFDGVADQISFSASTTLSAATSISVWTKFPLGGSWHYNIFGVASTTAPTASFFLANDVSSGISKLFLHCPGFWTASILFPNYNQWNHIAVVSPDSAVDGQVLTRLYINGVLAYSNDSSCISNIGAAYMGSLTGVGYIGWALYDYLGTQTENYHYKGSIDDLRVYNRALNANEVMQLYRMGK